MREFVLEQAKPEQRLLRRRPRCGKFILTGVLKRAIATEAGSCLTLGVRIVADSGTGVALVAVMVGFAGCGGESVTGTSPRGTGDDRPRGAAHQPEDDESRDGGAQGVASDDRAGPSAEDEPSADDNPRGPAIPDDPTEGDDPVVNPEPARPAEPPPPNPLAHCGQLEPAGSSPELAASILAQTLLGEDADEELLEAAALGLLDDAEGIFAYAERLVSAPRAHERLGGFGPWWLGPNFGEGWRLNKDPELYPEFGPELESLMIEEARLFTQLVASQPDGTLRQLLTSSSTVANDELALLYGSTVGSGGFEELTLDPAERAGLFTQTYFLTALGTEPALAIHRGNFLRERLLCSQVPPPPCAQITLDWDEEASARQNLELILENPQCMSCHMLGTPMGFAFEHFDGLGRFRETDNGQAVDPSATVLFNDNTRQDFTDAPEMMSGLAGHPEVVDCFPQYWASFLMGRPVGSVVRGAFFQRVLRPESCAAPIPPDDLCGSGEPCAIPAPAEPVPCEPAVTVATQLAELSRCAGGPEEVTLQELAAAFAASGVLHNLTFACGSQRCINEVEYCFDGSAANQEVRCEPYRDGESGCSVRVPLASSSTCVCTEVENGGALMACEGE